METGPSGPSGTYARPSRVPVSWVIVCATGPARILSRCSEVERAKAGLGHVNRATAATSARNQVSAIR